MHVCIDFIFCKTYLSEKPRGDPVRLTGLETFNKQTNNPVVTCRPRAWRQGGLQPQSIVQSDVVQCSTLLLEAPFWDVISAASYLPFARLVALGTFWVAITAVNYLPYAHCNLLQTPRKQVKSVARFVQSVK